MRQRAVSARHERDAPLLPARHDVDLGRVVERVEHRKEAFAGHGEKTIAALREKVVDQDTAAGSVFGHGHVLARG